jgi:UDP-3-O-[3-hydroxymyristoyl] glucosamine N-acyltransferase
MDPAKSYTIDELAQRVGAEIDGPRGLVVRGVNAIDVAEEDEITFIGSERHAACWERSRACAAVVSRGIEVPNHDRQRRALLTVEDADLALAVVLELFAPPVEPVEPGIAADAWVHPTAKIDSSATIMSRVGIGAHTTVGPRTVIEPQVQIGADCVIGSDCLIRAGVVIRDRCLIGDRVSIQPNAVIGSDGFGYRPDGRGGLVKMPHIGIVEIHDDVEIGACTTIDRAKFGRTVIGAHTKLDNLVQIGHNVRLGRGCVLAAQSGLAGTVVTGDFCQIGGQVGIADHRTLGHRVRIAASSGVMHDIPDDETVGGTPALKLRQTLRIQAALHRLPDLLKALGREGS